MARKKTKKTVEKTYSDNVQKAIARITEKNHGRIPTRFQSDIYEWMLESTGHAVINAVAGSGKTTTLIDAVTAVTFGLKQPSILMLAFNKSIADELTAKISRPNCTAKTLNSLGMGIIFKNVNFKPSLNTDKTEMVAKGIVGYDQLNQEKTTEFHLMLPAIKRLVSLFKGFGYGAIRPLPTIDDVTELCDRYDVEINEETDVNTFYDLLFETYEKGLKNLRLIDFDDQLILPVFHNWQFPSYYNYVFVDESQDLNPIQAEMVRRLTTRGGRAVFVGDRHQAIYGFRGADPEAIDNVVRDFKATELPLSICWRCPVSVVAEAQSIVPNIESAPDAIEGKVSHIKEEEFIDMVGEGDFVIGRTCAPLVEYCMTLIRAGIKATVKGSDIGAGLISLLGKVAKKRYAGSIWDQIKTHSDVEVAKISKPGQETKAQRLQDRFDTLLVLAEGCETTEEVKKKIREIFSDNIKGVMLSTIHKVKGLESKRVFIVHPELLPHPMAKKSWARTQESNLKYVAITRATAELYWVTPENPIKFGKRRAS